ncbi:putative SH3 domain-containing protein [Helianthus annuus]|nr:putative SH3 domain-containing protein [Helianthus annuus]KAJ0749489.1 putative SH3 domain-containing protein [Helianthus annuus]KAJ0921751.1 putative SH3 domain-containing protein [Helianthus annuus]
MLFFFFSQYNSAKLINIYRSRHKLRTLSDSNDPVLANGISELIYEATKQSRAMESESFDDDLVNAWASGLADDGLWGNNTPAMNRVNEFLSGSGTDAPDVDDENIFAKSSNDDMWAKTLLEPSELDIREEPPPYSSPLRKRYESLENPLAGTESEYNYNDEGRSSSGNMEFGTALYDFTAGGDDEMSLVTGEELEIEYEVDGWFYVKKVSPGWDGKIAGLVPVLYVSRY